jgi:hypothetical protein
MSLREQLLAAAVGGGVVVVVRVGRCGWQRDVANVGVGGAYLADPGVTGLPGGRPCRRRSCRARSLSPFFPSSYSPFLPRE